MAARYAGQGTYHGVWKRVCEVRAAVMMMKPAYLEGSFLAPDLMALLPGCAALMADVYVEEIELRCKVKI